MVFKRITIRAEQLGGEPCIRGLRIPVAAVVGMVAEGMAETEILAAYPDLEAEDIHETLRYRRATNRRGLSATELSASTAPEVLDG